MKKIFMFCSLLVCSLLFLLSGCGNTQTAADTPKPYKIGVLRIDDSLPLYLAEKEQLFKKAGVPVKIIEFNSAIDQRKAMEAGELDGMMTDMIVTGLLKKGGNDVRIVATALGADKTEGRFLVVSAPNSSLKTARDLPKGNVAIAKNTMMEYLLEQYETELHLPKNRIKTIQLPNLSLRLNAVLAGKDVQAAILPDPLAAFAVRQGAHILIDDTKLKENYSQSVIILTQTMITNHRQDVTKFLTAYNTAIAHINQNPAAYRNLALQKANIPKSLAASYKVPAFTEKSVPAKENVQRVMNWMVSKHLLEKPYTYDEFVLPQ
ncbi:ABC transporter substrate-binding protein [Megasphaera lornae]|jgi:hypothetical protein|uniref:NLPA lipoprotein n=1 Tax=Megasphaera lornae TaxID=1000568 RepID=D3LVD5_9FIRM|nr:MULTISPECIES: ABC transporter substrate-binding protein [Megasphaera]EFD93862.1 NLPA lipoprotein [Megasphaera genomosp. type_1 str. 28L]EGL39843.1 NLPA lipoprotein [Megasphaera lornae]KXB89470.1 NLPA lipoprotein [Veillonellaceae bacterium DNF00751]